MNKTRNFIYTQYFFVIIILSLLFSFNGCQKNKSDDSFKFVFMTDVHIQSELNADEGFKMAKEKINELNTDFVITGGDLVMGAIDESFITCNVIYSLCILYNIISTNYSTLRPTETQEVVNL
jgi:predicted MPP superfamily phosphohydrolase